MTRLDDRSTGEITIALSHPQSSSGERRVTIQVNDEASNLRLLDISLTPEEFADLMGGRFLRVSATIPAAAGTARLFRQRDMNTVPVPAELGSRYDYTSEPEVASKIDAWAAAIAADEGWDEHQVVTSSQRFYATFLRWAPREA